MDGFHFFPTKVWKCFKAGNKNTWAPLPPRPCAVTPCPVTCPGLGSGSLGAHGEDTGARVFAREHSQPSSPLWLMSWGPTAQRCLRTPFGLHPGLQTSL